MFYQFHSNTTVSLNLSALVNALGIMNLQQQPLLTAVPFIKYISNHELTTMKNTSKALTISTFANTLFK